jgi:hypothetical protein
MGRRRTVLLALAIAILVAACGPVTASDSPGEAIEGTRQIVA